MEKKAKIVPFFYKEQKRTQRLFCSFIKNGKERKDGSVLLKRMDAHCPTLFLSFKIQNIIIPAIGLYPTKCEKVCVGHTVS